MEKVFPTRLVTRFLTVSTAAIPPANPRLIDAKKNKNVRIFISSCLSFELLIEVATDFELVLFDEDRVPDGPLLVFRELFPSVKYVIESGGQTIYQEDQYDGWDALYKNVYEREEDLNLPAMPSRFAPGWHFY